MSCKREFLPLCSVPARVSRDGFAGPNAKVFLPFYGFYFFNAQDYTFPGSTVPQYKGPSIGGTIKHGTFSKSHGICA